MTFSLLLSFRPTSSNDHRGFYGHLFHPIAPGTLTLHSLHRELFLMRGREQKIAKDDKDRPPSLGIGKWAVRSGDTFSGQYTDKTKISVRFSKLV